MANLVPAVHIAAPAYVAGRIGVPVGLWNLLGLIRSSLELYCSGSCYELAITADADNSTSLYLGAMSPGGGALSATNFGYELEPGQVRHYYAAFPGATVPLGAIQIFATSLGYAHVEVF